MPIKNVLLRKKMVRTETVDLCAGRLHPFDVMASRFRVLYYNRGQAILQFDSLVRAYTMKDGVAREGCCSSFNTIGDPSFTSRALIDDTSTSDPDFPIQSSQSISSQRIVDENDHRTSQCELFTVALSNDQKRGPNVVTRPLQKVWHSSFLTNPVWHMPNRKCW